MDLHLYRNSQDRWHDLKAASRDQGAVLAFNAVTLSELVEKLTPEVTPATLGQQLLLARRADPSHYAYDAILELKSASREAGKSEPGLSALLDSYQDGLARSGFIDPIDRVWLAARRAGGSPQPWLQRFDRVVLHAIYDLSGAEFALVGNVIEALPDGGMVILFNATANVKPTQFAEWTWQRFIRDESLADRTFPAFCRSSSPNFPLLERLFVFEQEEEPLAELPSLRIVQVPGRYREIEAIASEVADLLARGESGADIAVVVRHIETYGEMLEDVFCRFGIPHAFDTGVPLLRVPFIKYCFSVLDLVTGERTRDGLARVLSSAYFVPRLSPAIDVERELAAFGYISRHHLSGSDLARRKNSPLTAELQRFESLLDKLEVATDTIGGYLAQLQPPPTLTPRDRVAWNTLLEELQSMDGLGGSMPFAEFRSLAAEVAAARTVDRLGTSEAAPGVARVRVVTPRALGHREYRWIFAPGFADGEFPSRSASNPLLPDTAIESINAGIWPNRIHTLRDRQRREPLYLFMILDSARDQVTLTFPASTIEGEPMVPSIYIGEIARHFKADPVERSGGELRVRESGEYLRRVADAWRSGSIDDLGARELLGPDLVRRARLEESGPGRGEVGQGVVATDAAWHPSELNALAECPFIFLARHRMQLRTAELPDFEVPVTEVGKLAHEVLREFYSTPIPALEPAAKERMDGIIQRRLADADISGQGTFSVFEPALWKIRREQLVAALHTYVRFAVKDALDGYETLPEYLGGRLPSARMGSVLLGGKPDHVAVRRIGSRVEGIRVDDFKYSAASSTTQKLLKDSFQIPIYAYLARLAVRADDAAQIDGRYLLLRSPATPVMSHAIDATVFDELQLRIESLVAKARGGHLRPDPADRQDCRTCDYRRLCRLYGA